MNNGSANGVLLSVRDVHKHFRQLSMRGERVSRAVDGVSLELEQGEILGVAGESGCGKSTLSRLICGLVSPTSGEIVFNGRDIRSLSGRRKKEFRRQVQMVFQDPEGSLNPRRRIGSILQQPFQVHRLGSAAQQRDNVLALLERVKLTPPDYYASKFPYELSGGSKQRVAIARALALEPSLVLADEPVASLDMSIRGAILMLLRELNRDLGISMILISHDLNVLQTMASRIAIMYLGRIVEIGSKDEVFSRPRHPYTQALLSVNPIADPRETRNRVKLSLTGDVPSSSNPPSGCRFHTRCPHVVDDCLTNDPVLTKVGASHDAACPHWKRVESLQQRYNSESEGSVREERRS